MSKSAVAFCAAALGSILISAVVASSRPILAARWSLLWLLALWAMLWVSGVALAVRLPTRVALALVLVAALAVRAAALAGGPTTSDDLYRYSWDGHVQAAGIDPYQYPPAAPQLAGLRESWLWPDAAQCHVLHRAPRCTRINRPDARTIYPPGAEAWFSAVHHIAGGGARYKAWQVAGLLVDLTTVGLLAVAAHRWGRDPRWVALYALCPAPVLEFVNNGHVDGVAVALTAAAFAVAARPGSSARWRAGPARDVAVGLLLGVAVLVKLYPAVVFAVLPALPRARPWRSALRSTLAAGVVAVAAYLPHVLRVGAHVLGYLPGYLKEEHYDNGSRILLLGALGIHGRLAAVLAGVALATAVTWVLWRRPPTVQGAAVLLGMLLLVTTPVQPWYAISLLAIATIAGWPWWAVVVAAGYPYFFAVILDYRHTTALGQVSYAIALLVIVAVSILRIGTRVKPWTRSISRTRPKNRITPTHASWLNQGELFFCILEPRLLRRGEFDWSRHQSECRRAPSSSARRFPRS